MQLEVHPGGTLKGEGVLPGDKSISHRAIILGALAQGQTIIHGFLAARDCLATLKAMQALGVNIHHQNDTVIIDGVGLQGLKAPQSAIDCQNAGTAMRLLAGVLAPQSFHSTLIGDRSLNRRPMERIIFPLREMGAHIEGVLQEDRICAPLQIQGSPNIKGFYYTLPVASAQVKSCLLLAGLYAKEKVVIIENTVTRDHTERMLKSFGCHIETHHHAITLFPGNSLKGHEFKVPCDISSAAFFIAGASFTKGAHILFREIGVNPTRMGLITILQEMGANILLHHLRELNGEPVADIEVRGSELKGITVPPEWIVSAIDEFPIIFVAAACAQGETIIRGIQELRFKETDRIAVMAKGLKTLGVPLVILRDGIVIRGAPLQGGVVESEGDHRIAMAFAMAGLASKQSIQVNECENVATSFPHFCELANQLGLSINEKYEK